MGFCPKVDATYSYDFGSTLGLNSNSYGPGMSWSLVDCGASSWLDNLFVPSGQRFTGTIQWWHRSVAKPVKVPA